MIKNLTTNTRSHDKNKIKVSFSIFCYVCACVSKSIYCFIIFVSHYYSFLIPFSNLFVSIYIDGSSIFCMPVYK
jgi:hypothetical protein